MTGRPYPSYPEAERASEEYAYVDPKTATYAIAKLPREFHPLDAWKTIGTDSFNYNYYRWWYPSVCGLVGFSLTLIIAYVNRQPIWGNIPRTILVPSFCAGVGELVFHESRKSAAKRDAVIQHYLEEHYDEFSKIKRFKYGEVFLPWKCNR